MSTPAKHKNLAKRLLGLSLNDEGRINEASVTEILDSLRKESPIGLKSILRLFLAEIRKHEQTYHARAEIGCNEEKTVVEKILHHLYFPLFHLKYRQFLLCNKILNFLLLQ